MTYEPVTREWFETRVREYWGTTYQLYVTSPAGRLKMWTALDVLNAPHWKHCTLQKDTQHDEYKWVLKDEAEDEGRFIFGKVRKHSGLQLLKIAQDKYIQSVGAMERQKVLNAELEDMYKVVKAQFIAEAKQRKAGGPPPNDRLSREVLRERILASDDVLDVRYAEEAMYDYGTSGIRGKMSSIPPIGSMIVTFVGPLLRHEDGVVATPPSSFVFRADGEITGGPIGEHPHVKCGSGGSLCRGDITPMIANAKAAQDVYLAVDAARAFRLGWDVAHHWHGDWQTHAWDWWCKMVSNGWPKEEPFQKPWLARGMPCYDSKLDCLVPLRNILGGDDREYQLRALHLARDASYWSRAKYGANIMDVAIYVKANEANRRALACTCGGVPPAEYERIAKLEAAHVEGWVGCACHTDGVDFTDYTAANTCPTCTRDAMVGRYYCYCKWTHARHWKLMDTDNGYDYRCERRSGETGNGRQCPGHSRALYGRAETNVRRIWFIDQTRMTGDEGRSYSNYFGPRYLCEKHVDHEVERFHEAPVPVVAATLRMNTADPYLDTVPRTPEMPEPRVFTLREPDERDLEPVQDDWDEDLTEAELADLEEANEIDEARREAALEPVDLPFE